MSFDDIAIRVEGISKCFQIYDTPRDRLKQFLAPRWKRVLGKAGRNYFREFWAVRDVSFEVRKGETVGIVGRNGSGKSTLLQMICGTLSPTSGLIETSGRIAALLELGSGFNPEFTGRENVFLNASVLGLSEKETEDKYDYIASFADIGDFIEQPVKHYSSGMVVRLAFAVQAMIDPDVLIVDEALAVGDEKFQRKCFARLEQLKNRGTSILLVSHSGPQVVELCDRALLLEQGQRVMYALPKDTVKAYQQIIYASDADKAKLIFDFKKLDLNQTEEARDERSFTSDSTDSPDGILKAKEFFDPGLVPESTTIYPEQGARIERFEIQTEEGHSVNVLYPFRKYKVIVEGQFISSIEKVYFGLHIRSISGAVVSGQQYPAVGTFIEEALAGKRFRIAYWFNLNLLPGAYFMGGGIWSTDESTCAHRILDAIMFRVQSDGPTYSFGYCDLIAAPAELRIDP